MKNIIKALIGVFDKLTSKNEVIISEKRIKGIRSENSDELIIQEQLEELSDNVALLDDENIFIESNLFEKPVYGAPAIEDNQFITLMQLRENSAPLFVYNNNKPSNFSVGGVPKASVFEGVGLQDLLDWIFYGTVDLSTVIEFEVTVTPATINTDIPLISMYNTTGAGQFLVESSDGFSELNYVPALSAKEIIGLDGNITTVDDGDLITHRWEEPGVYLVKISTSAEVLGTKFTNLKSQAFDRIAYDVNLNPHITKLIKYKSPTIDTLNYTFAGLSKCVPAADFVLETPEVKSAYASFFRFGDSSWKANALSSLSSWEFNKDLLAQCSQLLSLNGTFYLCNLKRIPIGFFDALENVAYAFDTFKRSSLGHFPYVDYTLAQYLEENLHGDSFIPMNLLHKMPKLIAIEGMFNAVASTNRQLFGTTGTNSTNSLGYGNWANLGLLLKADFFFNGKEAGNTKSTIQNIDYVFGKANQIAFEKDLFRYIKDSIVQMEGAFTQIHWVLNDTVAQSVYFNYSGLATAITWLNTTTLRIDLVLGNDPFPNCIKANGAFAKRDLSTYTSGLNGTYDIWGFQGAGELRTGGVNDTVLNHIMVLFEQAYRNQNPVIQAPTAEPVISGLSGFAYAIRIIDYSSFGIADNSMVQAIENWDMVGRNVIWY